MLAHLPVVNWAEGLRRLAVLNTALHGSAARRGSSPCAPQDAPGLSEQAAYWGISWDQEEPEPPQPGQRCPAPAPQPRQRGTSLPE